MRVGIFGSPHVGGTPDEFSGVSPGQWFPNHSISSSSVGLQRGFERHGFEAFIADPQNVHEADVVFACEWNFFKVLHDCGNWDFQKPTVIWLHHTYPGHGFTGDDLKRLSRGICFTRVEALSKFRAKWGDHPYWHAPWATPEWWSAPPVKPDPYDHSKYNVVYAGRCAYDSRMPEYIRQLTARFSNVVVHIISDVDMLMNDARNKKIVAEFESNPQVNFLGSQIHGTFLNYLYYANLALDTGIIPSKIANNCKIWDYLAMGVPIVTNHDTGGMELVRKTGCGLIAAGTGVQAWLDAFEKAKRMKFPRKETIKHMADHHTWEKVVGRWVDQFDKVIQ